MRGISIFQKPSYREFHPMRERTMRGLPVCVWVVAQLPQRLSTILALLLNFGPILTLKLKNRLSVQILFEFSI